MIYLFCENVNQVYLSKILCDAVDGMDFSIILTRFINDSGAYEAAKEIFPVSSIRLIDSFVKNQSAILKIDRKRAVKDYLASLLRGYRGINVQNHPVVIFNDSSLLAASISREAGKAILIQDGYLGYRKRSVFYGLLFKKFEERPASLEIALLSSLYRKIIYPHFRFGQTRPCHIFVYGNTMKKLMFCFYGLGDDRVTVIGSLKRMDVVIEKRSSSSRKILFVDQCLVKYGDIDKNVWKNEIKKLIQVIIDYGIDYKFHPSEDIENIDYVKNILGDKVRVLDEKLATDKIIGEYGVIVTFFSSVFVDAHYLNIPVIYYQMPGLKINVPKFNHENHRKVNNIKELRSVIASYNSGNIFKSNLGGENIDDHVSLPPNKDDFRKIFKKVVQI